MWQKLKRIDVFDLKEARTQLINASQLVSAAPRSFTVDSNKNHIDWLLWDENKFTLESIEFGSAEKIRVALDIEQFILSIYGQGDHIEHLVLSGITYPMAYGWMRIKLDSFQLDGGQYYDTTSYTIANPMGANDEMCVTSQHIFDELKLYFANAWFIIKNVEKALKIHGSIQIDPSNLNMLYQSEKNPGKYTFGFSPGDEDYPEPYFFIQFENPVEDTETNSIGIWNTKKWNGLVYGSGEFLTLDPDQEYGRVMDFFMKNFNLFVK